MRRIVLLLACLVVVLAACSSGKKDVTTATTTTVSATSTTVPATTTTAAVSTTVATSTGVTTTTSEACPNTGSTGPRSTTADQPAALLTKVAVTTAGCRDSVTFTFREKAAAVPSCKVQYQPGPFTQDGSGAPVQIAGTAFVVVRCSPAYGYDFEAGGGPTYTGPKRVVAPGAVHVREVHETGDFEGVVTWVIGLDGKRAFAITAGGTPERQLIITFS